MRALCGLAILLASTTAFADEEVAAEEHHHHENHAGIFVGLTTGLGDNSSTYFTLGAEYERRLTFIDHRLGAGVLIDTAFAEGEKETLAAGFVAFHPYQGLMILAAAGTVFTGAGDNAVFAVRGGAAYFLELGKVAVGPAVNLDHANGENALVYGVAAGAGF